MQALEDADDRDTLGGAMLQDVYDLLGPAAVFQAAERITDPSLRSQALLRLGWLVATTRGAAHALPYFSAALA